MPIAPRPAPLDRSPCATRGLVAAAALVTGLAIAANAAGAADVATTDDVWPTLRSELFGGKPIIEDSPALTVEAPKRAEDAALVPVKVTLPAGAGDVRKLTLIVDKNPAPMAAAFTFGPAAATGERVIETRLRFDMYSNLRVVAETTDGTLHMVTRFVKAAGGCSAPALKDADDALAMVGKTMVRDNVNSDESAPIGQVMVRHPNYSGMQMNQLTGLYIPAKYVTNMSVARGAETVFDLEAGISLSEDPNIRFTYAARDGEALSVTTTDSDGRTFTGAARPTGS